MRIDWITIGLWILGGLAILLAERLRIPIWISLPVVAITLAGISMARMLLQRVDLNQITVSYEIPPTHFSMILLEMRQSGNLDAEIWLPLDDGASGVRIQPTTSGYKCEVRAAEESIDDLFKKANEYGAHIQKRSSTDNMRTVLFALSGAPEEMAELIFSILSCLRTFSESENLKVYGTGFLVSPS